MLKGLCLIIFRTDLVRRRCKFEIPSKRSIIYIAILLLKNKMQLHNALLVVDNVLARSIDNKKKLNKFF
jgi:hypothetical protein